MMPEILHVGIDLGTSRSAISASNGEKFVVDSFVGWPADMVAKKVLKRSVLIGHDAVANRTMGPAYVVASTAPSDWRKRRTVFAPSFIQSSPAVARRHRPPQR